MTPLNRTLEGKTQTLGGVKNDPKKLDIIYGCSLVIQGQPLGIDIK
jgi:hypothetical protein